jgi:tetratricopeptide (TPR) repeat protein
MRTKSFVNLMAAVITIAPIHAVACQVASAAARTADSLFRAGDFERAASAYEAVVRDAPRAPVYLARLGISLASLKRYDRALDAFQREFAIDSNPTATYNVAAMLARLDRRNEAFTWLDRAVTRGFIASAILKNDEDFAMLRDDDRFAKVVARLDQVMNPCVNDANARKFDFWVGKWDVRTTQGGRAGSSVVELVSGRCALLENWSSANGGAGKSLNAYNKQLQQWQQFWVGQTGDVTEYRESQWDGATLRFLAKRVDGSIARMSFTPVTPDHVRQHGEDSSDGGKTWTTRYDLQYHRVK